MRKTRPIVRMQCDLREGHESLTVWVNGAKAGFRWDDHTWSVATVCMRMFRQQSRALSAHHITCKA